MSSRSIKLLASLASFLLATSVAPPGHAKNPIQLENEKPVDSTRDNWLPALDPVTYAALNIGINGTIDGYPSKWSVRNGETLGLRVSTTAPSFRTRIYRIGWYPNGPAGAVGSRLVYEVPSTAGVKQAFPPQNSDTGIAEAKWSDTLRVTIPSDWVSGHYAVRFTTSTGKDAFTYFVLRDDMSPTKAPIVYVDTLTTGQAYNPWPKLLDATGKQIQGKSLYLYNSAGVDVKATGEARSVEVSTDRPHGENWGLGIWRDWTIPMVQWLEQKGYDVAYADSLDLQVGDVLAGRRMWMDSGHDEYWSSVMWDNLENARNKGLSLAFFSGNDFTWQIRLKPGSGGPLSTVVGYKTSSYPNPAVCSDTCVAWGGDPEWSLAYAAKKAGKISEQIDHLKKVSYAWGSLRDWDPVTAKYISAPVPIARTAIELEGLVNGPKTPECTATSKPDDPCWGVPFVVQNDTHWIYTGAGVAGGVATLLKNNDHIPQIVGYEMDNAALGTTFSTRPVQIVLAKTDKLGYVGGFNAQYYDHSSGARVFAAGTINWSWGLQRDDLGQWGSVGLETKVGLAGATVKSAVSGITVNVLNKLLETPVAIPPIPVADAGPDDSGVTFDSGSDSGVTAYDTAPSDGGLEDLGVPPDDDKRDSGTSDSGTSGTHDSDDPDLGVDAPIDSTTAADRDAGQGDGADAPSAGSGGCGCTTPSGEPTSSGILGAAGLVALATARRRRSA